MLPYTPKVIAKKRSISNLPNRNKNANKPNRARSSASLPGRSLLSSEPTNSKNNSPIKSIKENSVIQLPELVNLIHSAIFTATTRNRDQNEHELSKLKAQIEKIDSKVASLVGVNRNELLSIGRLHSKYFHQITTVKHRLVGIRIKLLEVKQYISKSDMKFYAKEKIKLVKYQTNLEWLNNISRLHSIAHSIAQLSMDLSRNYVHITQLLVDGCKLLTKWSKDASKDNMIIDDNVNSLQLKSYDALEDIRAVFTQQREKIINFLHHHLISTLCTIALGCVDQNETQQQSNCYNLNATDDFDLIFERRSQRSRQQCQQQHQDTIHSLLTSLTQLDQSSCVVNELVNRVDCHLSELMFITAQQVLNSKNINMNIKIEHSDGAQLLPLFNTISLLSAHFHYYNYLHRQIQEDWEKFFQSYSSVSKLDIPLKLSSSQLSSIVPFSTSTPLMKINKNEKNEEMKIYDDDDDGSDVGENGLDNQSNYNKQNSNLQLKSSPLSPSLSPLTTNITSTNIVELLMKRSKAMLQKFSPKQSSSLSMEPNLSEKGQKFFNLLMKRLETFLYTVEQLVVPYVCRSHDDGGNNSQNHEQEENLLYLPVLQSKVYALVQKLIDLTLEDLRNHRLCNYHWKSDFTTIPSQRSIIYGDSDDNGANGDGNVLFRFLFLPENQKDELLVVDDDQLVINDYTIFFAKQRPNVLMEKTINVIQDIGKNVVSNTKFAND